MLRLVPNARGHGIGAAFVQLLMLAVVFILTEILFIGGLIAIIGNLIAYAIRGHF
jgi:hypothetical protein